MKQNIPVARDQHRRPQNVSSSKQHGSQSVGNLKREPLLPPQGVLWENPGITSDPRRSLEDMEV